MKKAIYCVITGNYDTLKPIVSFSGWDCICFTDDPDMNVRGWEMRVLPKSDSPVRQQRGIKILAHEFLPDYDLTIYMDGNMEAVRDPSGLIRQFRGGLMTKTHPRRNCVYQEGQRCIELGKADAGEIRNQLKGYIDSDVPAQGGMWETGVIIRDRSAKDFCEAWHDELTKGTHRDQIAISAAVHKTGFKIQGVPHNVITSHFRLYPHKPKKT